jgi:uncharacterized cofD-like protein
MKSKKINITTIGGGSGQFILLSGLRDLEGIEITAVVSMVDSGGSTGRLRDEYGVLPPGDILKCVIALSPNREAAREILQKRFSGMGRLNGHVSGNMLLTILSQYAGSFPEGVKAMGDVLNIKGAVFPVTTDKATLTAELNDGSWLYGEKVIDMPDSKIQVYPPVISAIKKADFIIIGPGDLYTSITPNFLVKGVKEAIQETQAKIIYIINIMTKFGETDNFTAKDFISTLEKFIDRQVDMVVLNSMKPGRNIMSQYEKQDAKFVKIDLDDKWEKRQIIKSDLLNTGGDIARHDSDKLAKILNEIIKNKNL